MNDVLQRVALIVAKSRGCDQPDSAKSTTGHFPCAFCHWSDDPSYHESGCFFWAEKIIEAMK